MNALQKFLVEADTENITQVIDIGGRLAGKGLTIKPLSGSDYTNLQNLCLDLGKNGVKTMNAKRFNEQLILKCLVDPNLRDSEMMQAVKAVSPEDLLYKVFLAGEIATIANQILELSGFGNETKDLEDVKN